VSPSELPDYKPPFLPNSVRADASGNVWVRTIPTRQIPGGPVYDVINGEGKLIDRVQVPAGRTIIGFGSDGAVYLATRDTSSPTPTMTLERAPIK
jgi:sugar lactone lactonase YvrE